MKRFRCVDFETTGLPPDAGVIQVGVTDLIWEGKTIDVGQTYEHLCNPGIPIQPAAMGVHHITDAMIEGKPHPASVIDQLEDDVDFIVAHNLRFEQAFTHFTLPSICTLKCARKLLQFKDNKLQTLRYALNLEVDPKRAFPPHHAGPDTYVTAVLLRHLLIVSLKMGGDFVNRLISITAEGVTAGGLQTHCEFGKNAGRSWEDLAINNPGFIRWILNNDRADPDVRRTCEHWAKIRNITT